MKKYIKEHKYFIFVFLIFVILTFVSGYQSLKISNYRLPIFNQLPPSDFQDTATQNVINVPVAVQNVQIEEAGQAKQLNDLNAATSTIPLQTTSYKLEATATSSTVYDLMMRASADSRVPFLFTTKEYPGIGHFVESINGLKNDTQAGTYWIYYLNDKNAQLGISQQIVNPKDIITWKYETANF